MCTVSHQGSVEFLGVGGYKTRLNCRERVCEMEHINMLRILFLLCITFLVDAQLSMDSIGNDEFHTNYVDYDTDGDRTPTCTSGDPVRVQRSIDYSVCRYKAGNPCKDCEIYRIRYEKAARPCVEEDLNFRERFEEDEEVWTNRCPCYPNCNSAARYTTHGFFIVFILLAIWNNVV